MQEKFYGVISSRVKYFTANVGPSFGIQTVYSIIHRCLLYSFQANSGEDRKPDSFGSLTVTLRQQMLGGENSK